ncbi:MAG: DUF6320 domain-containing protein [Lachnospiraceae bacterium]|nr:DUF6320 domain-containing protein [Lachnospiraceae bacterium]
MSYCVNCGVELEASLKSCPLCHTPVINPNELKEAAALSPYPAEKGKVDVANRKDFGILTSIVLIAASLSCLLLNLFVFPDGPWSLFIIGACLVLFVLVFPAVIYTKLPVYISLLFDGVAIGIYLYLISFNTTDAEWFWRLALPIVALTVILVEIFALLLRSFPVSFLATSLYFFIETAFLCIGIELLIQHYLNKPLHLTWSAIVMTVCSVIVVLLITLLSIRRFRDAARRRLHF